MSTELVRSKLHTPFSESCGMVNLVLALRFHTRSDLGLWPGLESYYISISMRHCITPSFIIYNAY